MRGTYASVEVWTLFLFAPPDKSSLGLCDSLLLKYSVLNERRKLWIKVSCQQIKTHLKGENLTVNEFLQLPVLTNKNAVEHRLAFKWIFILRSEPWCWKDKNGVILQAVGLMNWDLTWVCAEGQNSCGATCSEMFFHTILVYRRLHFIGADQDCQSFLLFLACKYF